VLGALALEKHPDKTFIGRIERSFDFLGYHFSRAGLTVAKQTIANFIEKASRLYSGAKRAPSLLSGSNGIFAGRSYAVPIRKKRWNWLAENGDTPGGKRVRCLDLFTLCQSHLWS